MVSHIPLHSATRQTSSHVVAGHPLPRLRSHFRDGASSVDALDSQDRRCQTADVPGSIFHRPLGGTPWCRTTSTHRRPRRYHDIQSMGYSESAPTAVEGLYPLHAHQSIPPILLSLRLRKFIVYRPPTLASGYRRVSNFLHHRASRNTSPHLSM